MVFPESRRLVDQGRVDRLRIDAGNARMNPHDLDVIDGLRGEA